MDIDELFKTFARANPEPKGELNHVNPYTLLVAVTLSAQATDKGVNKATESLFKKVQTPKQMLALGEEGLRESIRTIGLFRTKAKNVIKMSELLLEHHGGEVPQTIEELVKLPGVGRKTANVVLNMAFGKLTIAVDTHVLRVSNRMGLAKGSDPNKIEQQLLKVIPRQWLFHAHHWLILHGRYICKSRKPECSRCPVVSYCMYIDKKL
jgi:endonuclease-3